MLFLAPGLASIGGDSDKRGRRRSRKATQGKAKKSEARGKIRKQIGGRSGSCRGGPRRGLISGRVRVQLTDVGYGLACWGETLCPGDAKDQMCRETPAAPLMRRCDVIDSTSLAGRPTRMQRSSTARFTLVADGAKGASEDGARPWNAVPTPTAEVSAFRVLERWERARRRKAREGKVHTEPDRQKKQR